MFIESLDLKDYRNYEELHVGFSKGTNLLYGDNAQGKTNVLEALYLCAAARSHRGSKDREIIRFGCKESHIRMKLQRRNMPYVIDIHLKKDHPKGIAVNGIPLKKASELFGILDVVCFSPEDLYIIKNGPSARRRFVDSELCLLSPLYVKELVDYNRTLVQKNHLLREYAGKSGWEGMLDIYDEQLKSCGDKLIIERRDFLNELDEIIRRIHREITSGTEELKLKYESCDFRDLRKEELRQHMTLSGPHRDDIGFYINGKDLRTYGSQGQQRTAALSLKLAEIELVGKKAGEPPVLLLDDVLSELDTRRQNKLVGAIGNIQTIITAAGIEEYLSGDFHTSRMMHVVDGTINIPEVKDGTGI